MLLVFAILLIIILVVLVRCIVIVPQSNAYVTEWLGVYKDTWGAGLHIRTPFVERISRKVSLKEEAADFPPQPVITRDNVTMMIDTVVFFQVFDAKMYAYGVNRPIQAIENLSATTLRDIIGSMTLDETLTSRDLINTKITASLDEATDRWGIKVNRVELKNIEPPVEIRQAMEKQMKADREKRAPPQPVITRDNVTMMIDTVVFFQVFDAKMYAYGVNRPIQAIENLSATTLRDIIGSMTLDETLTSRDLINTKITASLDEATDRWGIKVNRVELKNIEPPVEIRQAMEKQMKADREKRASILLAEGEKQAAITRAEGEKESAILRAEAVKQQRIREAEGEAEALLTVQKAQANAIRMINEANPNHNYLALRSMEAMEKVADGKATKLIVPSDMQNLAATVSAIKEISGEVTE